MRKKEIKKLINQHDAYVSAEQTLEIIERLKHEDSINNIKDIAVKLTTSKYGYGLDNKYARQNEPTESPQQAILREIAAGRVDPRGYDATGRPIFLPIGHSDESNIVFDFASQTDNKNQLNLDYTNGQKTQNTSEQ